MAANWFLVVDGKRHGPFTARDIGGMVSRGEISPDTLAWRPGRDSLTPADMVPVASFMAHAGRFAKRPAYAAAWMSLVCHALSLLFFITSGRGVEEEWFRSPQWWVGFVITTGFLVAAVWSFEVDYAHTPLWLMPLLASVYGIVTAACLPVVMDGVAFGTAETFMQVVGGSGGKMFLVLWGAVITQWLVKLYGTRRLVTVVNYGCVLAMIAAGIVLMSKYVAIHRPVTFRTAIEFGFFAAFAIVCLIGARIRRPDRAEELLA